MPLSAMEAAKTPASNPTNMVRGARSGTTAPANYKAVAPKKQPTRRKKRRPAVK